MNWTEELKRQGDEVYNATRGLMGLLEDKELGFRPPTGSNWMSMGQLLAHIETACGQCCQGFVDNAWGEILGDASPDEMLPPAERMPSAPSVAGSLKALAADQALFHRMIDRAGEARLESEEVPAPWNPRPKTLGRQLDDMVGHLSNHRCQLFYYLKAMGKPVHTGHLYGMA